MATKSIDHNLAKSTILQDINSICSSVNTVRNSKELLEISLKMTMSLFSAKRGSIFIFDNDKKHLILKIASGMNHHESASIIRRLGEGIVGKVAQAKKPIIVQDIANDSRFNNYRPRNTYQTPSFICAPLLVKDTLIGVINIADKAPRLRFHKEELQLLDFISSQIALNYKRVQLYQKFKKILRESKTLKSEVGKFSQETSHLRKQIIVQEKFASLGKLAGGIAHEFNNPLDGVIRYTNLSLEHLSDDEIVRGYLLEIKHGLNRMARIVRNLLACSRNFNSHSRKVDLTHVIDQVINSFETLILTKEIKIEKRIDKTIPTIIDCGIELIFSNLIRNAIDAIDKSGKIIITTQISGTDLIIQIKDNGCGIEKSLIERIFEPFFTTKEIDKGCGLGLTIVQEIVKSYSGKIALTSTKGKGSTFLVYLPHPNTYENRN